MRCSALWLPCALLVMAVPVNAQQPLTLRDAAASALRTHPSVDLAAGAVERASAVRAEARSSLFPSASLETSATRFQEPMAVAPLHGFDPQAPPVFDRTLYQGSVNVLYQAFDGGARDARVARSAALLDGAVAGAAAARQSVIAETARRYVALVTARELLEAQRARVNALEQERARAARLYDEGRAARVLLLRADASLSAARAELTTVQAEAAGAELNLARTMGVDASVVRSAAVTGVRMTADAGTREEFTARAAAGSPDVARLEAGIAAARQTTREMNAQWWPRLSVGGRYVRYASGAGDAGGEWQTGVQLQYPLFTGGSRPASRERADAELRAARAELALTLLRITAAVDDAWTALESARARSVAWTSAVEQSGEVARIERLSLDTGAGVQSDYLAAESDLLRARASLTQARASELLARIELARLAGILTLEWIEQNVESVE